MKKPTTYQAGDDKLLLLYDPGELDHVCGKSGLLIELADPAPNSEREAMAEALRNLLGMPIERLQARIVESGRGTNATEWDALERFALAVESTAVQLPGPLDKDGALALSTNLRAAWLEFIAYGSAYRMYYDLPREFEVNKRKTATMRDVRNAMAYAAEVDHGLVITRYAELVAAKARGKRRTVAAEFGLAENTVRNIWNVRDRTKYP